MPAPDPGPSALLTAVEGWRPEPVVVCDPVPAGPPEHLRHVLGFGLGAPGAGERLPALWHWLYFLDWPRADALGPDGHPAAGAFLPPLPDRRRMWAGGRLDVRAPLIVGVPAVRTSTLAGAEVKTGRSGSFLLVTVRHEIVQRRGLALVEEQDHVYRVGGDPGERLETAHAGHLEREEPWQATVPTDERTLFAMSALTANSHRIHYDAPYAREVEGYPGLVVHGPLLVLAQLELARRDARGPVTGLDYRLSAPVFAGDEVLAVGTPDEVGADLQVVSAPDRVHARARVRFGVER